jgi:HlyD family secretion protein
MKKLLFMLVLIGLAAAGAAYLVSPNRNGSDEGYSYESVKYGTITDVVNATGIVKPTQIALVFSKAPGTVEEIIGKVGQHVDKNQPLFTVNNQMAQRTLERANAELKKAKALRESAKAGLDYLQQMQKIQSVTISKERELEVQTKHDAAVAGEEEAQSALRQAQLLMDWTTVRAPLAGTIIERNLYLGQPVGPSVPVGGGGGGSNAGLGQSGLGGAGGPSTSSMMGMTELRVPFIIASDLSEVEVYAQISQGDVGRVKPEQKAQFTVDSFPDLNFEGKLTDINLMPVMVQGATIYPAVIKVKNKKAEGESDWILRPGMTVNVDITRDVHTDVWKLPNAATNLQLDPQFITKAAQQEIEKRRRELKESNQDLNDWVLVWKMGDDKKPWPLFVRLRGKNDKGKPGIKESSYTEVLEWEKGFTPKANVTELIIAAPQPKGSILDRGTQAFKIS